MKTACSSLQVRTHLYSLVLVNAKAVHEAKDLFAVLAHARLALCRQRLLMQNWPLHRNVWSHPFVLFNLRHGETLRRVEDQHPADQVLTVWKGWKRWCEWVGSTVLE